LCFGIVLSRIHANPKTVSKHTAPRKSVANSQSRVTKTVQKKSAQEKAMSEKDKDPKGAKEAESSSKEVMEVDADEAAQAPTKGKRKLLILVAIVVVVLLAVAGVLFSGVLGGKEKEKEDAETTQEQPAEGAEGGEGAAGKPVVQKPVYYELPEFLVNLTSATNRTSFLKMSVTLELRDKEAVAIIEANSPRIMDMFNTYLREVRPQDLSGSAGIFRLRGELMMRINRTIEEGLVKDILFSEIIIQ
jgi:flagellar FliL protein